MSPLLNKTIPITHLGDGIVTFSVPFLLSRSPQRLILQTQTAEPPQGNQIQETPLFLELLKIGGNLQNILKKNGSFYVELLQEGFLKNGAITLIGLMPKPPAPSSHIPDEQKKIFKAIIQLDGDIICQIDRAVLKEKHATELIEGYALLQSQFFEDFNKVLHATRLLIAASLAILIASLYITWNLFQ